jgi:hypothetical protein
VATSTTIAVASSKSFSFVMALGWEWTNGAREARYWSRSLVMTGYRQNTSRL